MTEYEKCHHCAGYAVRKRLLVREPPGHLFSLLPPLSPRGRTPLLLHLPSDEMRRQPSSDTLPPCRRATNTDWCSPRRPCSKCSPATSHTCAYTHSFYTLSPEDCPYCRNDNDSPPRSPVSGFCTPVYIRDRDTAARSRPGSMDNSYHTRHSGANTDSWHAVQPVFSSYTSADHNCSSQSTSLLQHTRT